MNIIALNLSKNKTEEDLIKLFAHYGAVESCDLVMDKATKSSKGFGFIQMLNEDEANAAITALHGSRFGGNKIRVKEAVPQEQE